jgi:hypothetical protein
MAGFRYQPDVRTTLEPWREKLGAHFEEVAAKLMDRDRTLEDTLDLWLNRYAAGGYASVNGTAAVGWTLVPVDTISWSDTSAATALSAASGRYTCPADGLYECSGTVAVQLNNAPQVFRTAIWQNAAAFTFGTGIVIRGGTGGDEYELHVTCRRACRRGDVLDLRVFNGGGNACTIVGGQEVSWLHVHRVGPYPA